VLPVFAATEKLIGTEPVPDSDDPPQIAPLQVEEICSHETSDVADHAGSHAELEGLIDIAPDPPLPPNVAFDAVVVYVQGIFPF
jgi:hypothetical protein